MTMTKEEMRSSLARKILEAMIYLSPEEPQLHRTIGDLLAGAPQGTVRVIISVEECDPAEGESLRKEHRLQDRAGDEKQMLTTLGVRLRVDGKNIIECASDGFAPHDYILLTPSSDTPPAPADAPAAP